MNGYDKITVKGLGIKGSIPIFSLDAELVKLLGNTFPLAKLLSNSQSLPGVGNFGYTVIDGGVKANVNLDLEASLNLGSLNAWLTFENGTYKPVSLNSVEQAVSGITRNILDSNNDGKADIKIEVGYANPKITGNISLSTGLSAFAKIGEVTLGQNKFGPLFNKDIPLLSLPAINLFNASKSIEIPKLTFTTSIDINDLVSNTLVSKPVLTKDDLVATVLETKGNTFLGFIAVPEIGVGLPTQPPEPLKSGDYVIYKADEIDVSKEPDNVNYFDSNDLFEKGIYLVGRNNQNASVRLNSQQFYTPYGATDSTGKLISFANFQPKGVEITSNGKYEIIFEDDGYGYYLWSGVEKIDAKGKQYIEQESAQAIDSDYVSYYEKSFNQDFNHNNIIDPGARVFKGKDNSLNIYNAGNGYYTIGESGKYLVGGEFPGEIRGAIGEEYNYFGTPDPNNPFEIKRHRAVIFIDGTIDFPIATQWDINENNEKIAEYKLTPEQLGYYERVALQKDITGDGKRGVNLVIDSDVDKNEYTLLALRENSQGSLFYAISPDGFGLDEIKLQTSSGVNLYPYNNPYNSKLQAIASAQDANGLIDLTFHGKSSSLEKATLFLQPNSQ